MFAKHVGFIRVKFSFIHNLKVLLGVHELACFDFAQHKYFDGAQHKYFDILRLCSVSSSAQVLRWNSAQVIRRSSAQVLWDSTSRSVQWSYSLSRFSGRTYHSIFIAFSELASPVHFCLCNFWIKIEWTFHNWFFFSFCHFSQNTFNPIFCWIQGDFKMINC